MRFHTVWIAIEAKPHSSAMLTKAASPAARCGTASGTDAASPRSRPSSTKVAPTARLTTPVASIASFSPSQGSSTKPAASAPTKAPAVLRA